MKTVFIMAAAAAAATTAAATASPAHSEVFHTPRDLLASHFRASERVSFVRVRPAGADRARVEQRLGRALARDEYVFYVASSGERVDGYALSDQELGQHEMIDIGTFFDPRGEVTRVEVLAYREPYGGGVRAERFRRQFVGKDGNDRFRAGRDIDIISGATISSHSISRAVHRAAVLLMELLRDGDHVARR